MTRVNREVKLFAIGLLFVPPILCLIVVLLLTAIQ